MASIFTCKYDNGREQKLVELANSDEYRAIVNKMTPGFTFATGGKLEEGSDG